MVPPVRIADLGCEYVSSIGVACLDVANANVNDCTDAAVNEIADACADVFDCP